MITLDGSQLACDVFLQTDHQFWPEHLWHSTYNSTDSSKGFWLEPEMGSARINEYSSSCYSEGSSIQTICATLQYDMHLGKWGILLLDTGTFYADATEWKRFSGRPSVPPFVFASVWNSQDISHECLKKERLNVSRINKNDQCNQDDTFWNWSNQDWSKVKHLKWLAPFSSFLFVNVQEPVIVWFSHWSLFCLSNILRMNVYRTRHWKWSRHPRLTYLPLLMSHIPSLVSLHLSYYLIIDPISSWKEVLSWQTQKSLSYCVIPHTKICSGTSLSRSDEFHFSLIFKKWLILQAKECNLRSIRSTLAFFLISRISMSIFNNLSSLFFRTMFQVTQFMDVENDFPRLACLAVL